MAPEVVAHTCNDDGDDRDDGYTNKAGLDEGLLSFALPHSRLYEEFL